jgi:hypothetical protein
VIYRFTIIRALFDGITKLYGIWERLQVPAPCAGQKSCEFFGGTCIVIFVKTVKYWIIGKYFRNWLFFKICFKCDNISCEFAQSEHF